MADLYGMMMDGLKMAEAGKQESRRRGIADLMGKAYNAPAEQRSQYLGQMAGIDPEAAMAAGKQFGGMDDDRRAQVARHAQMFDALPDEQKAQAYPQLAAEVRNLTGMPIPDAYDPKYLPAIQRIAGIGGGEAFTLSPGSKRFGPNGEVIAEVPFAPANTSLVNVPDGQGGTIQMIYDPRTQQFVQPNYGGQPSMPAPTTGGGGQVLRNAGQLDPVNDFPALSSQFGTQVSSLARDPRHNAQVGGVGNSFHLSGEAGDFVVPAAQRPAFIAAAKAKGYQAIDEGDHVHVEPPGRGMTASQFGQGQRLGYAPPKGPKVPNGYRLAADGVSLEPIPGGPAQIAIDARRDAADAKRAAQQAKEAQAKQAASARQVEAATNAGELIAAIDNLTRSSGFGSLGTAMGDIQINTPLLRNDAKDANAQLRNISGQVALATMSRLKALSSQGATGFGALSQQELKLLENSIATLQSEDISNKQLAASLKVIRDKMQKVVDWKDGAGKYQVGQIIEQGGKRYRVTDVSDPNDPDVEEVP